MVPIIKKITPQNKTVMNGRTISYIVIHYTGNQTDTAAGNANYFYTGYRGASAHYFVDKTSIYQVVEDKDKAWAVGVNYGTNNLFNYCTNSNSISIEMCSDQGRIADATFKNTVDLTKELMKKYHIPAERVVRHYDVCTKRCPGWPGWVPNDEHLWNTFKGYLATPAVTTTVKTEEKKKFPYKVKVISDILPIRKHSNKDSAKVGEKKKGSECTIVQEKNGFGLLKKYQENKDGWINLKYTKKL